MAPGLDDAALVEGDGAEGAAPEAAPVGGEAELDLLNRRNAPGLLVAGVVGVLVGQVVGLVHLRFRQGLLGRVLDHELPAVGLDQGLGGEGVRVDVLGVEGPGIGGLVGLHRLPVREGDAVYHLVRGPGAVHGAVQEGQIVDGEAGVQGVGHLHNGPLPHAVEQQVRLGVQEDGALHLVAPVVVVGQPPETGLHAADEDGHVLVGLADQVAVDHRGVVGPLARDPAGGVGVHFPVVLEDGVVVHHGVHVPAHDQKAQPGPTQDVDGRRVFPVGLGDDAHAIPRVLQHPGDDGVAEGGVVHVGVADHVDKIALVPSPGFHILFADG